MAKCEAYGTALASIASDEESGRLFAAGVAESSWIGLYTPDGFYFEWVDGTPLEYTRWDSYRPNNPASERCVFTTSAGKWDDYPCAYTLPYVCNAREHRVTPAPPPPPPSPPALPELSPPPPPPSNRWQYMGLRVTEALTSWSAADSLVSALRTHVGFQWYYMRLQYFAPGTAERAQSPIIIQAYTSYAYAPPPPAPPAASLAKLSRLRARHKDGNSDPSYPVESLIDGDEESLHRQASCVVDDWVEIDLGLDVEIGWIELINEASYRRYLGKHEIWVGKNATAETPEREPTAYWAKQCARNAASTGYSDAPYRVMLECSARGRFVYVKLPGYHRCLTLQEVWVYSPAEGMPPDGVFDSSGGMRSQLEDIAATPLETLNQALGVTLQGSPWLTCGDGLCALEYENYRSCYRDCGCGDGYCDLSGDRGRTGHDLWHYGEIFPKENTTTCPQDCACGDGVCRTDLGESPETCQADCHCGDGYCSSYCSDWYWMSARGTVSPYRQDGVVPPQYDYCNEDPDSCSRDCHCGDGVCDEELWGETPDGSDRNGDRVYGTCRTDCFCGV